MEMSLFIAWSIVAAGAVALFFIKREEKRIELEKQNKA